MIHPSRARMNSSSRNSAQYFGLWDFYFDNKIYDYISLIQRLGLRDCSGKTIEEKSKCFLEWNVPRIGHLG